MARRPLAALLFLGALAMTDLRPEIAHARAGGGAEVEVVTTPGGLTAYLVRAPAAPFVSVQFEFKGGAALDPRGKEGLAYLVSGLLDEGAGDLDSTAFRTEVEDRAIQLAFDAGRDGFTGSLKTLTRERQRAFDLLRQALTEPRFDPEPVERIRGQVAAYLARSAENPEAVASETWFREAFGDHPYGRPVRGTKDSLAAIDGEDLRGFVARRLAKDVLRIGVAGDVTPEELAPLLDSAFGALPERAQATDAPAEPVADGGATRVVRMDVPQSVLVFGKSGVARRDPDYYPAYVANYILGGGGFSSRFVEEVREKRGLAYSVYSTLYPLELAPLWLGGSATNNARIDETLRLIREESARMAAGEVTAEELADAKTYLTGSFPLRLTSNDGIARMLVGMQTAELGPNYLKERNALIERVTLDDVRRVSRELFDPESLLAVVVGAPEGLKDAVPAAGRPG